VHVILVEKNSVKELGARWWTSATDQGCPGKMAWCGSGEMYSEQEMGPLNGSTANSNNEKCVALKASKSGELSLGVASCAENNRPLCEVNHGRDHESWYCNCDTVFVFLGQLSSFKDVPAGRVSNNALQSGRE
jgi:hypothetical protein